MFKSTIILLILFSGCLPIRKENPSLNLLSYKMVQEVAERLKGANLSIKRVAILPFGISNPRGLSGFCEDFTNSLSFSLSQDGFDIAERSQIDDILEEHKLTYGGFVNEETAKEISLLGVEGLILGEIIPTRKSLMIEIRLVNLATGLILWADHIELPFKNPIEYTEFEEKQFFWLKSSLDAGKKAILEIEKLGILLRKSKIAVSTLRETSPEHFGIANEVTNSLITLLVKKGYQVVERGRLESIISEHQLNLSGLVDPKKVVGIGELFQADLIITGDVLISSSGRIRNVYGEKEKYEVTSLVTLKVLSVNDGKLKGGGRGEASINQKKGWWE